MVLSPFMTLPVIADRSPVDVQLEEGKEYWWCRCGRSKTQPFCDSSHEGTGIEPLAFVAKRTRTYSLCRCKQTKNGPYCDDSHKKIAAE
jgi:CDGSH-type Zn-finger protein